MQPEILVEFTALFALGILSGTTFAYFYNRSKVGGYQNLASEIIRQAELDAKTLIQKGELEQQQQRIEQKRAIDQMWHVERKKMEREEERITQREDKLEARMSLVEKKLSDIEKREALLVARKNQLDDEKKLVTEQLQKLIHELEHISGLSTSEAKEALLARAADEAKVDAANIVRRTIKEAEEEAERRASSIIATAINRLAVSCISEATVTTVALPHEEMKGRIIGREGRNIRALEQATGITFIIDETPNAVVLSGFDPIRMHVAKTALQALVIDGRIHPTRIEEAVEKAQMLVTKQIKQYGEDAALRAGGLNLHPELIILLGKLKFRYSYGQNVLDHSLEVSALMGMMAAELGLDSRLAQRIGLLHDIGKAVSHEMEGAHAIIGHDFALRFGETKEVANGIGCHHGEMEPMTVEGGLCSAADAISAARQGARSEPVQDYIKRLTKLEELACTYPEVDKAFAMQAGREIRVFVQPDAIDDAGTVALAHELTKRIEQELRYPGKIKVVVIREKRVVAYAA